MVIVYSNKKRVIQFKNKTLIYVLMPSKHSISDGESNLLNPINHISFWKNGKMAYSALKRINELKANNDFNKAQVMLTDWIL